MGGIASLVPLSIAFSMCIWLELLPMLVGSWLSVGWIESVHLDALGIGLVC